MNTFPASALTMLPLYHVQAFAENPFSGNPAMVVPLVPHRGPQGDFFSGLVPEEWPEDDLLQAMGAEHQLSETAFVLPVEGWRGAASDQWKIRWFTPTCEVDICGHATLAAAHVVAAHLGVEPVVERGLTFESASGPLGVTVLADDRYELDFPASTLKPLDLASEGKVYEQLESAGGVPPVEVLQGIYTLVILPDVKTVKELTPDMGALEKVQEGMIIFAAAGSEGDEFDVVSRFFGLSCGIPEDPVTGSAHCDLIPYFAEKLGKSRLNCLQASARQGHLRCELKGDRVTIAGKARTYSMGFAL